MKKQAVILITLLLSTILILINCAPTVPTDRVWQPWIRTLNSDIQISTDSKLHIQITGKTNPLLGNEELLQTELEKNLQYLLERRGFKIDMENPDLFVILQYKTGSAERLKTSSALQSKYGSINYSYSETGVGASTGLGVSIARFISSLSSQSQTLAITSTETVTSYNHVLSLEILNKDKAIIWKGESAWDSNFLNIEMDIKPAIQLIVSALPSNPESFPEVPEIKSGYEKNYYAIVCKGNWFSCPALPYRIFFSEPLIGSTYQSNLLTFPYAVSNPHAMAAYIDLIQTAEYALPLGSRNYSNPLLTLLWNNVQLGGQYYLGSDNNPIKVLINLRGSKSGYIVDKCWIANDEEYENFENMLAEWRYALIDFYDVYVH
ncbi:MAG: hypothetical protein ACXAC7_21980 [Candidatus Hodarchaeales archaeon]|jgi:hypothetical protein